MDVRPYLITGVAVASTGALIAALPAVVPPATHSEVTASAQVPKNVYADVALRLDVETLINAFFATGTPGVTQELLLAIAGGFTPGQDSINAFFDGGLPSLLREVLIANGDPTSFEASLITGFFNGDPNGGDFEYPGIPDVVRQILIANGDPDSQEAKLINGFFLDGGAPQVVRLMLTAGLPVDSPQAKVINGFFDTGVPGVVQALLPSNPVTDGFFESGLPGALQGLLPSNPLTDAFFAGGAPAVVGAVLLGASNAAFGENSTESGAIKAFFTGYPPVAPGEDASPSGVPGLTHFIIDTLLGTVTPEPLVKTAAPKATTLAAARTTKPGATAVLPKANEPIDTDATTVTLRTTAPANAKTSATAPVAGETDPAAAPAPDDGAGLAEDVTDKVKSGNKAEVDPLLLENGTGGGGLKEAIQTWNHFLQKLVGGGGSKKPATGNSTTPKELPEPVAAQQPSK